MSVLDTVGAQYGQSGEGAVCVSKVWIPFHEKHYSVRQRDGGTERGCGHGGPRTHKPDYNPTEPPINILPNPTCATKIVSFDPWGYVWSSSVK